MATIVYTDNETSAADMLYHHAAPTVTNFLSEKLNTYYQQVGEYGNEFLNTVKQRFDAFSSGSVMRHIEALKFKASNMWVEDSVRYLPSIGDIQQAKPIMQRWIMANPTLRVQHYENGGISAYEGKYIDPEPNRIREDHYDYRRVTNGLFVKNAEGNFASTTYIERVEEKDVLTILEQCSILNTWTVIDEYLEEGELDPTSSWNEML